MNTLQYVGGDPLNPQSWRKSKKPLIQAKPHGKGPFGPGHGSFVELDGETLAIFHAADRDNGGWEGRKARVQRVVWTSSGPHMGGEVGTLVPDANAFMTANATPAGARGNKKHGLRGLLHEAKEKLKHI
jgi:GH43 family beta-xylosidase